MCRWFKSTSGHHFHIYTIVFKQLIFEPLGLSILLSILWQTNLFLYQPVVKFVKLQSIMESFGDILRTTYNSFNPPQWPTWNKQVAASQELDDYIPLSEVLLAMKASIPKSEWKDEHKLANLLDLSKQRIKNLNRYEVLFKILRPIFVISTISALVAIAINRIGDDLFGEKLMIASTTVLLLTGIPASILSFRINAKRQKHIQITVQELAAELYTTKLSRTEKAISKIKQLAPTVFFCEADGQIKFVSDALWKADCAEIALFLDMDQRICVSLIGMPPSGEPMFLRSEVFKLLKPNKNSENIYEKLGLAPNDRWCPFIRAVQSNMGLIRELVKTGERKMKDNILDHSFIPQINAYRVILDNSQNWRSMRQGSLAPEIKNILEQKLRKALLPEAPETDEAQELLNKFLKPGNRSFDKLIASWNIVPEDKLREQVALKPIKGARSNHLKPVQTKPSD